jgi:hypothetical protein
VSFDQYVEHSEVHLNLPVVFAGVTRRMHHASPVTRRAFLTAMPTLPTPNLFTSNRSTVPLVRLWTVMVAFCTIQ